MLTLRLLRSGYLGLLSRRGFKKHLLKLAHALLQELQLCSLLRPPPRVLLSERLKLLTFLVDLCPELRNFHVPRREVPSQLLDRSSVHGSGGRAAAAGSGGGVVTVRDDDGGPLEGTGPRGA